MIYNLQHFDFWEHFTGPHSDEKLNTLDWGSVIDKKFPFRKDSYCFKKSRADEVYSLVTDYYIGIDWLIKDVASIYIAPKVNTKNKPNFDKDETIDDIDTCEKEPDVGDIFELNYLAMLTTCMIQPAVSKQLNNLLYIDWTASAIPIEQKQDLLSPFLIVQFVNLLKRVVRKGLKNSYYTVVENLNNKVKGKILVGKNIRQNVLKNRFSKTACSYEEFGINSVQNRMLKKVLLFSLNYIDNHKRLFNVNYNEIKQAISFCRPAFENVSSELDDKVLKNIKPNAFFKDYDEAVKIGQLILKRFAFNVTNTIDTKIKTPPFWIDMPKLFELYVYAKLLAVYPNRNDVLYQFSTYGNALDFLITSNGGEMVIDAKYKLAYTDRHIHQDIRQVSGYSRLEKVYNELSIKEDKLIKCLIIYPNQNANDDLILEQQQAISAYRKVYKLGIRLPTIT